MTRFYFFYCNVVLIQRLRGNFNHPAHFHHSDFSNVLAEHPLDGKSAGFNLS